MCRRQIAGKRHMEELIVIEKTYELVLWCNAHLEKFPRTHRFVLGDRIATRLYDLFDQIGFSRQSPMES